MDELTVFRAELSHLPTLAPLFDGYRMFYQQPSDLQGAADFLRQRLQRQDSIVLIAEIGGQAAGFVQVYPSFSSVSMGRIWVLNDLYVHPHHRQRGVADSLLREAQSLAQTQGVLRIVLSTQKQNDAAQRLYRRLGYRQDLAFDHYALTLEGDDSHLAQDKEQNGVDDRQADCA